MREDILKMLQYSQVGAELHAANIIKKLQDLQDEHEACVKTTAIIRSLYVEVLRKRWSDIELADHASSDWIFGPDLRSYTSWLENETGVFLITGKVSSIVTLCIMDSNQGQPGSGKSTLMKFVSDHARTHQSLERWAAPSKLYTASFFFWNQGFELQMSQKGLFQSLLYQILRSNPSLATHLPQNRLDHESWELQDLRVAFQTVAEAPMDARFCFFIDGLDEYDGTEKQIVEMLSFLTRSPNIKICASSRPRSYLERKIHDLRHNIDIANYTETGMAMHVRHHLLENPEFQQLRGSTTAGEKIVKDISKDAEGVWLWVYLVTRELERALEMFEEVEKLQKILDSVPRKLNKYFQRMIDRIDEAYKEDMAMILLIAVHELQPLPLFAFSLLDEEIRDPHYALSAVCKPIPAERYQLAKLRARLESRCGDLMVVKKEPHPIFLAQPVKFAHKTMREYLLEHHHKALWQMVHVEFDPVLSLCRMQLYLLKSVGKVHFQDVDAINRVIALTDNLLYYAHELERNTKAGKPSPASDMLDELDKVNARRARRSGMKKHWTHIRDDPKGLGMDQYFEGEDCNFLALCVQARLIRYVEGKLAQTPARIAKRGRPLLDYALRPLRRTPVEMRSHSQQDDRETSVNVEMVKVLLARDPERAITINKPLYAHRDRSTWQLLLISCFEHAELSRDQIGRNPPSDNLRKAWYDACNALIQAGADPVDCIIPGTDNMYVSTTLERMFGSGSEAQSLLKLMNEKRMEEEQKKESQSGCQVM
jgi:hypothetical protein